MPRSPNLAVERFVWLLPLVLPMGCGSPSYDLQSQIAKGDIHRTTVTISMEHGQVVVRAGENEVNGTAKLAITTCHRNELPGSARRPTRSESKSRILKLRNSGRCESNPTLPKIMPRRTHS